MKKDVRTERRIDYTKREIAEALNVSENTVDYQIKNMCEFYGIKPEIFKRYGGESRNFFPLDYTSLLILLLKSYESNPAARKKTTDVTAKEVADYNKVMLHEIDTNRFVPNHLRETAQQMPWYREAGDISEWSALLVEELTQLIINLTKSVGGDIGQTIKYICRELDYMNYNLFRGSYIKSDLQSDSDTLQKKMEKKLYQEICDMEDDERLEHFASFPEYELFYNAYKQTNGNIPHINRTDMSIDRGILSIMEALMAGMGLEELQDKRFGKLPEFLDKEEYEKFRKIMNTDEQMSDAELIESEREWYLNNQEDAFMTFVDMFLKEPGRMEFVAQGRKWKSIPERIEAGIYHEDYHEAYLRECKGGITEQQFIDTLMKLDDEEQKKLFAEYLDYYKANKEKNKDLHDIVSRFIGQVMLNYLSVSKEK